MSIITSVIRPAPGSDGPFFVVSEQAGSVTNVTTGVATIAAALDQCKADAAAMLAGAAVMSVVIRTTTDA